MILRTLLLTICISITACCTSKKTATDVATVVKSTTQNIMTESKMIAAGFKEGKIIASKDEGDCPFVIEMPGDQAYFLDPINLTEPFKKDGMNIWFKFRGLRIANRCPKANPITLEEIHLKE